MEKKQNINFLISPKGGYFLSKSLNALLWGIVVFLASQNILLAQEAFSSTLISQNNLYFTSDALGSLYLISDKEEIIKYNQQGQETFRYSNTRLSNPTFIDATDPFNVLVYYQDYQTAILLDRTMTETALLNFADFGYFNLNAVAMSADNKIWLYDELDFRLKRIDRNGKIIQVSDDLSLLLNGDIRPNFIIEREQYVFVNVPNMGILMFDFFGQFIKKIDLKNLLEFQVIRDRLFFQENEKLLSYNLKSLLISEIKMPKEIKNPLRIQLQQGLFFCGNEKEVLLFKIL